MSDVHGEPVDAGQASSAELVHALLNHVGLVVGLLDIVLEDTEASDPRRPDLATAKRAALEIARLLKVPSAFEPEAPTT